MLEVWEKSTGQLGGRKRLLGRVRTAKEGEALIADIGHKVKWLTHTVEEMTAEDEKAAITDIEREERLLAIEERRMELAERKTRMELAQKMAATAGKLPVDAEAQVREFLAKAPEPKVTRPDMPPVDTTDPTEE